MLGIQPIVAREKLYTAEEFYQIAQLPENAEWRLELEDGILLKYLRQVL